MAVTQYIGARYVPLIMDEWDSTREYEPLSVVLYQGASYTSRQAVPVGIPITNEDFWALTGNYNAQVEAYRQEVRRFDGRITDNETAIADEAQARADADTALGGRIDAEAQARADADTALGGRIDAEAQARADADTALGGRIDAEAQARADADTALGGRIDAEAEARAGADNALGGRIDAEAAARANAITSAVDSLTAQISKTKNQHRSAFKQTEIYYINPSNGNDNTGKAGYITLPFKTLEAAYEAASLAGNDLRFTFLKSGVYNLPARLFVGCVLHLTAYAGDSTRPAATGTVQINIVSNNGAVFFYDSHVNFAGNENCNIVFNANYEYSRYINNEGSVFWCNWTTFNCTFLQLIQGGSWFNNCIVNGYINGWFADVRIRGMKINNTLNAPAIRLSTGSLRFEESSERGYGIYISRNPNITGETSAIYLETMRCSTTSKMHGASNMGYYRYMEARGSVVMAADSTLDTMNSFGNREKCNFPSISLRVRSTTAIGD